MVPRNSNRWQWASYYDVLSIPRHYQGTSKRKSKFSGKLPTSSWQLFSSDREDEKELVRNKCDLFWYLVFDFLVVWYWNNTKTFLFPVLIRNVIRPHGGSNYRIQWKRTQAIHFRSSKEPILTLFYQPRMSISSLTILSLRNILIGLKTWKWAQRNHTNQHF